MAKFVLLYQRVINSVYGGINHSEAPLVQVQLYQRRTRLAKLAFLLQLYSLLVYLFTTGSRGSARRGVQALAHLWASQAPWLCRAYRAAAD